MAVNWKTSLLGLIQVALGLGILYAAATGIIHGGDNAAMYVVGIGLITSGATGLSSADSSKAITIDDTGVLRTPDGSAVTSGLHTDGRTGIVKAASHNDVATRS
jgi:hypothetical protein